MRSHFSKVFVKSQLTGTQRRLHPATLVGWGLFLAATVVSLVGTAFDVNFRQLIRDPASEFAIPIYAGALSHLGIWILVATAAIAGFAAVLSGRLTGPLAITALLSACLVLDDQFLLHEEIGPNVLGIPEILFYLTYLGAALWLLWGLRRDYPDVPLRGLVIACYFLGLSVITDVFKVHGPFSYWLEDFSKLAGFGAWLVFWASLARHEIGKSAQDQFNRS